MISIPPQVYLSAIDEERFGVRTVRASEVTFETLPAVIEFCRSHDAVFLIVRCPTTDLQAVQTMEQQGFLLMDTLVVSTRNLQNPPLPADTGEVLIRAIRPGEENAVKHIAAVVYRDYMGHYHADTRLDRARCDETYVSWAERSCASPEVADHVLVADLNGAIVGFFTLKLISRDEGQAILSGVLPEARNRGLYRSFMIRSMEWFLTQGAARMVVATQITNIAVQKVWARVGFEPNRAYYTLHKWFE